MSQQALIEAIRILADFPIDEFGMASKPDSYGIFRSNDWQLTLGHVRAARRAIASCQQAPSSPPPPMESLGRNGDPKVVASVVFDSAGMPKPVWHMGAGTPGTIVYLAEHDPDAAAGAPVADHDARAVLQALLDHVDETTCTHESTHRGGAIWTICDHCDAKWADDRGGFKPHEDAQAVAKARALLASEPPATPDAIAWIRYRSDGGIEGPILDAHMGDIRRKSGAWTPLGRLIVGPPPPQSNGRVLISGVVESIGNDETGKPRLLIRTTRDRIQSCKQNLLFKQVVVRLADSKEVE